MAPVIIVLLVVGAALLFVVYTRAKVDRQHAQHGRAREQIERVKSQAATEDHDAVRAAEMVELAARLAAQLDTKAMRIEQLIERAEIVIKSLQRLSVQSREVEPGVGPHDRATIAHRAIAEEIGTAPPVAPPSQEVPSPTAESVQQLAREIILLAEEGHSAVQISQRLEEATGKVELILALHRQSQRTEAAAMPAG